MPLFTYTLLATDFGGPYCLSPTFSPAVCHVTTQYKAGGIVFGIAIPGGVSAAVPVATIADGGVLKSWVGCNTSDNTDLLTQVNMQIVLPGTTTPGTVDAVQVEAGLAADGNLTLSAYSASGVLLAARVNGLDGLGPDGRSLITLGAASFSGIPIPKTAYFVVSTSHSDTFAVNQISNGDISPIAAPCADQSKLTTPPSISAAGTAAPSIPGQTNSLKSQL